MLGGIMKGGAMQGRTMQGGTLMVCAQGITDRL